MMEAARTRSEVRASCAPFTATAGDYTISFEGLNPDSGAALIDAVTLNDVLVANGSFEAPALTGTDFESYNPTGANWTFAGEAGVARAG
ncbi:MAG TPA: hypothetical protein VK474_12200, partial [Chthoniobacterales bacterium]|nr:hypothetical protein [Chthoniobacterales bacterium]